MELMGSSLLEKLAEKELDSIDNLLRKMPVREYPIFKKIGLNDKMGFGKHKDVVYKETPYYYRCWLKKNLESFFHLFSDEVIKDLKNTVEELGRHCPGSNCSMFD